MALARRIPEKGKTAPAGLVRGKAAQGFHSWSQKSAMTEAFSQVEPKRRDDGGLFTKGQPGPKADENRRCRQRNGKSLPAVRSYPA